MRFRRITLRQVLWQILAFDDGILAFDLALTWRLPRCGHCLTCRKCIFGINERGIKTGLLDLTQGKWYIDESGLEMDERVFDPTMPGKALDVLHVVASACQAGCLNVA